MVILGLPDLVLVEKDPVSLNLCKVHCTAPFETLTLSALLRCDMPSLHNAIIWPLILSLRSLHISIQDMERGFSYSVSSFNKTKKSGSKCKSYILVTLPIRPASDTCQGPGMNCVVQKTTLRRWTHTFDPYCISIKGTSASEMFEFCLEKYFQPM